MSNKKNINYTVAELIDALKQFPENLPVVVSGYESGFENIVTPQKVKLEHKPNNKYWDGEFQNAQHKSKEVIEAVILQREVRNV